MYKFLKQKSLLFLVSAGIVSKASVHTPEISHTPAPRINKINREQA